MVLMLPSELYVNAILFMATTGKPGLALVMALRIASWVDSSTATFQPLYGVMYSLKSTTNLRIFCPASNGGFMTHFATTTITLSGLAG